MSSSISIDVEQKICKVKIFQLQSMYKAITCINERFTVVSGFDIQLEQSKDDNAARKNRVKFARYNESYPFFDLSIRSHGSVVKASRSESWRWDRFLQGVETHLPLGHFSWWWAGRCTDTCAFILLHFLFFFRGISSQADRVLTLNVNIRLPSPSWQGFNSSHQHPTSPVFEHLESDLGPGLGPISGAGAWEWL